MDRKNLYYFIRMVDQKKKLAYFEESSLIELRRIIRAAIRGIKPGTKSDVLRQLERVSKRIQILISKSAVDAGVFTMTDTSDLLSYKGRIPLEGGLLPASEISKIVDSGSIAGKSLDSWVATIITTESLRNDIKALRARGTGYKKSLRILAKDHLGDGTTKRDLETIMISYMQSINAKMHDEVFKANKRLMVGYEWSAVMENGNVETGRGTCPRCSALDGRKEDKRDSLPFCPLHPRCRCLIRPVPKDLRGLSDEDRKEIKKETNSLLRANGYDEKGQHYGYNRVQRKRGDTQKSVQGEKGRYRRIKSKDKLGLNEKYSDWWMGKGKEWQDNAIGKTRAELVRAGRIKFKDLVDRSGKLIPIKELVKGM